VSSPELLLENQVCFLFHRIDRAILARYRPLLAGLGLTYPQYLCMLALWERDGRTVGELCAALALDTGTVSPLLKRLELAGLLDRRRQAGGEDERVVTVHLSPAGRELEERARGLPGSLASCLFVSLEDYRELKSRLQVLLGRLETGTHS
jgi:DNA-binding MarR family transcriptional regulator